MLKRAIGGSRIGQSAPAGWMSSLIVITAEDAAASRVSATSAEVKCAPVLKETHVRQAEDHRAGLKHTHGLRSGKPIVVVREETVVSEGHAARVRLIRV